MTDGYLGKTYGVKSGEYGGLEAWLKDKRTLFLVAGDYTEDLSVLSFIKSKVSCIKRFSDYDPNPDYKSIVKGINAFNDSDADGIIAIGGGSAIDVAKCIRLWADAECTEGQTYLDIAENEIRHIRDIPFIAVPTTAGTGSEATRFAVIYYNGNKQSISSAYCMPDYAILDSSTLYSLPVYHRKSTMLDALCHAAESWWSINSTDESIEYSRKAMTEVLRHWEGYLDNTPEGNEGMLWAAHTAGMAINISKTTAGHAMCYKLTGLYGISHGHSAGLVNRILFPWMVESLETKGGSPVIVEKRGENYLRNVFSDIAAVMGEHDARMGAYRLREKIESLNLEKPVTSCRDYEVLRASVNSERLKNNPIFLDEQAIDRIYHEVLK